VRSWRILAIFGVCLCPAVTWAGLYNPAEPGEVLHRDPNVFWATLKTLSTIGREESLSDPPERQRYFLAAQVREVPASWGVTRRLSQSAYWIRRQKFNDAIALLDRLKAADRRNFLVRANRALAVYLEPTFKTDEGDNLKFALRDLEDALRVWPADWEQLLKEDRQGLEASAAWTVGLGTPLGPALAAATYQPKLPNREAWLLQMGWTPDTYRHYRTTETFFRKLLELRRRELMRKTPVSNQSVDALFGTAKEPLRFVGESGGFEPGKLAQKERAKLPPDAVEIVQQLLLWMPDDRRLQWLLAELYNAQGDIVAARQIFKELGDFQNRYPAAECQKHYETLAKYRAPVQDIDLGNDKDKDKDKDKPKDTGSVASANRVDWNSLVIGFGAGVVAVLFVLFQIQEIRRRRQKRAAMARSRPTGGDQPAGTNNLEKQSQPGKVA
jgi:tetratricopeptide (TPR) repeat protein